MQFLVPAADSVPTDLAERAYLSAPDGLPWRSINRWESGMLTMTRQDGDSAYLHAPWISARFGQWVLISATLAERPQAYILPVELARGTLNRVINQHAIWQAAGFEFPSSLKVKLREARQTLGEAVSIQHRPEESALLAAQSLDHSLEAIELLTDVQWLESNRQAGSGLQRRQVWACRITKRVIHTAHASGFCSLFNAAAVETNWHDVERTADEYDWGRIDRAIEWSQRLQLLPLVGPLVSLSANAIPDWAYLWEGDAKNLESYLHRFVREAVRQFKGRTRLWHAVEIAEGLAVLGLSEEARLRLLVSCFDVLRQEDEATPAFISFCQPWGEYLARGDHDLSPLNIADALIRGGLRLSAIGLELDYGYWPGGTPPRDLLQVNDLVDDWSNLGVPLIIMLSVPSDDLSDIRPGDSRPGNQTLQNPNRVGVVPIGDRVPNPNWQADTARRLVSIVAPKRGVSGIIWKQWRDRSASPWPYAGLIGRDGAPKPALEMLVDTRKRFIQ